MAALRCTSVHGLAAIDRGAVIAAGASVWGISFRFGDSGVAAIREGASVSAAVIRTATATATLQLGYPIRRQGGIDVIGRVLGNATQHSGRMREAPQKGGISVSPGGLGHCADGRLLRATLARQADRRVLALADHTFTLERACDAGIGAARGLKRRLSMRGKYSHPRKSCQTWPAVLALMCPVSRRVNLRASCPLEPPPAASWRPRRAHVGCTRRRAAHEAQGDCGRGRELGRRRYFSQPRCRSWGIELFCWQRSVLYRCLKAHPAWSDASQTDGDGSACQGAGDGRPRASVCGLGHR